MPLSRGVIELEELAHLGEPALLHEADVVRVRVVAIVGRPICELHRDSEAVAVLRADLGQQLERLDAWDVRKALRCLDEGVLRSPRDGDVAAIFGVGFPPFRGGPFRYMDSVGVDRIVEQLEELNDRFPPRFQPAESLIEMARRKERFYDGEE